MTELDNGMTPLPPTPDLKAIAEAATLPDVLPDHWTSAEGREMAVEYLTTPRNRLGRSDLTDFALANAVFLADRRDLDPIVYQTAAKERIRWLSAHLASLQAENARLKAAHEAAVQQCIDADAGNFANARRADAAEAGLAKALGALERIANGQAGPQAIGFTPTTETQLSLARSLASQVHAELHPKDKSE
jgi:hypothetical protein